MNTRLLLAACTVLAAAGVTHAAELQEVASFANQQVTGVGVSQKSGRIFVNFPLWSDDHLLSVAEIIDGQPRPFPNEEWNKPGDPSSHFVCVQSVVVDDEDNLWVLDPAAPKMQEMPLPSNPAGRCGTELHQRNGRPGRSCARKAAAFIAPRLM
jgi:hypothetical protein